MTTAILSALAEEQGNLVQALHQAQCHHHAGRDFWLGELAGQPVVLALSGIGKVAAATTTTTLIERFGAQRVLFTGVAGGLGPQVAVGDVVVAQDYVQHDMDASPIVARWQVPGYEHPRMACDPTLTALLSEAVNAVLTGAEGGFDAKNQPLLQDRQPQQHQGLIASGDRFVSSQAEAQALRSSLEAGGHPVLAVEMEGAAVAQVCQDYGLPFAAMRSISDRADDNAALDFNAFVQQVASRYAEHIVLAFLERLSAQEA